MKVNLTMDMTPEEARKLMGLPDVEPLQQEMMEMMREKMLENMLEMSDPEIVFKRLFPIGVQGMEQFQRMFNEFSTASANTKKKAD